MNFLFYEATRKLKEYVEQNNIPLNKIVLSFSGGKDSSILLHMIKHLGWQKDVHIVFSNTRMEFDAIYDFVKSQDVDIEILEPKTALPLIYLKYGMPIHSKYTSEMIYRLQKHKFDFVNDTYKQYDDLIIKYPKCKGALKWLCNQNIKLNCPEWLKKQLKDITFKVSNKCCEKLKKDPMKKIIKKYNPELVLVGIRKAEGGIRSIKYKGCILKTEETTKFFPMFHWTDSDVWNVIKEENIPISKAYTQYGCERTGCVGCPFSKNWQEELNILKTYEPNKYNFVTKTYEKVFNIYANKRRKD